MEKIDNAYLDLYRLYEGEPELYRDYFDKACESDLSGLYSADIRFGGARRFSKGEDAPRTGANNPSGILNAVADYA